MTTSVWSTVLDHSSNAGYQAWATELIVKLLAVNVSQLTQTADTGQLANPVVAARPAINTAAGYWIFKWTDGSSTDLYFKIETGTGAALTTPQLWVTVGTGSDGAGNLTGKVSTRTTATCNTAPLSTTTNYTSYLCCATGGFSLGWKMLARGAIAMGEGYFGTYHSVDDSGVVNNDGYVNYCMQTSSIQAQSVNLTNGVVFSGTIANSSCLIPYTITASVVSGNAQYFRHFAAYPLARPLGHVVSAIASEFSTGTSFSGESGSITDHTFISMGSCVQQASNLGASGIAFLWQ